MKIISILSLALFASLNVNADAVSDAKAKCDTTIAAITDAKVKTETQATVDAAITAAKDDVAKVAAYTACGKKEEAKKEEAKK